MSTEVRVSTKGEQKWDILSIPSQWCRPNAGASSLPLHPQVGGPSYEGSDTSRQSGR
jgi:hypothetical protein